MNNTIELIQKSQQGDEAAKEQLIQENTGLIWAVTKRFLGRGTEADDLYQLGCLGFIKAIDGFDMEFGTQFSTYAVPKIAGEIRRFLRDDGVVKVSRGLKEKAALIKNARIALMHALGTEPTIQQLSDHTGLEQDEIILAENATATVESIYYEHNDEGFSLEHILSDTESEESMIEKLSLYHAIELLPERESSVIKLRYFHGLTQNRVAKILNVSQVQVSRIEKKALSSLRKLLS